MAVHVRQHSVSCAAILLMALASAPARAARPLEQIEQFLQQVNAQIRGYPDTGELVQPKYRQWMKQQFVPILQRKVDLLNELAQADPGQRTASLYQRDYDLAVMAVVGDAKAAQTLEQDAAGSDATAAMSAKMGLCLRDWWSDLSVDAQRQVLNRVTDMAKASPKEDAICRTLVALADHGAASEDLAREAHQTAASMSGPLAIAYKATPNKLGWPLVISGNTVQGKSFSTEPWKGKVVLVDFWATWCPPCRASLPHLEQLYQQYHDKGLEVIGVSNDQDRSELVNFLRQNPQMAWPQLFAPSSSSAHWHRLAELFKVSGIPTVYLIDRNGILRLMETGGEADKTIKQLLEEQPDPTLAQAPMKQEPTPARQPAPIAPPPSAAVAAASAPPADASAKAAPPADDPAVKAARAVSLAKSYIAAERYDDARSKLQGVVTTYPGTPAARDAEALLTQIAGK